MIDLSGIINLNSYIRIESIREGFENECKFVTSEQEVTSIDLYKDKNIIFENSLLKTSFFESLNMKDFNYTVINCLSSEEIFEKMLNESTGMVVFDNVCSCRNNNILESIINYKKHKMLVC